MSTELTPMQRALDENPLSYHGREIAEIFFPPTPFAEGAKLVAGKHLKMGMSATHHGDHDEFWVVVFDVNAKGEVRETGRYNPRYLEGWVWAKEEADAEPPPETSD